jgi:hypothetical protein
MRFVAVTEGDKVAAEARFGYSVNGYGIQPLPEALSCPHISLGILSGRDLGMTIAANVNQVFRVVRVRNNPARNMVKFQCHNVSAFAEPTNTAGFLRHKLSRLGRNASTFHLISRPLQPAG